MERTLSPLVALQQRILARHSHHELAWVLRRRPLEKRFEVRYILFARSEDKSSAPAAKPVFLDLKYAH
jgi:hypothetical protein